MFTQGCEGHFYQCSWSDSKTDLPIYVIYCLIMSLNSISSLVKSKRPLSEVGFEPTTPFGDQKPQQLRRIICLESGALDHSAILTHSYKDVKGNCISEEGQMAK